jgi:hypothetical protein
MKMSTSWGSKSRNESMRKLRLKGMQSQQQAEQYVTVVNQGDDTRSRRKEHSYTFASSRCRLLGESRSGSGGGEGVLWLQ